MRFFPISRRTSTASTSSSSSSPSTPVVDEKFLEMTVPISPREDDYNMSEKSRQERLLATCRKAQEPWKSAKALPAR